MQSRHRTPTVFSMSMVDVLCCALGCVILLWLVNSHEAKDQEAAVRRIKKKLDEANARLKDADGSLLVTRKAADDAAKYMADYKSQLDAAMAALSQHEILKRKQELTLEEKERAREALARLLAEKNKILADKDKQLVDRDAVVLDRDKLKKSLEELLADQQTKAKQFAQSQADQLKSQKELQELLLQSREKILALQKALKDREGDLLAKDKQLLAELAKAREEGAKLVALSSEQEKLLKLLAARDKLTEDLAAKLQDREKKLLDEVDRAKKLGLNLAAVNEEQEKLLKLLALRNKEADDFARQLKLSERDLKGLKGDLDLSKQDMAAKLAAHNELVAKLRNLIAKLEDGTKDLDGKLRLHADASKLKDLSLTELTARLTQLEADKLDALKKLNLAEAGATRLTEDHKKALAEARSSFERMSLTGSNVVFIIDISGSMAMRDPKTPDATKWPMVCDHFAKLVKSIPDLKSFQVILFSNQVEYLFPTTKTQMMRYDGPETVKVIKDALLLVKPNGGTRMYPAFEEAFKYRGSHRIDAVYLFSDGLPNETDVLPPNAKNLTEAQLTEFCARQIREKLRDDWNAPSGRNGRIPINTVGFYFDSPEVGAFLWALARENEGSFVGMSRP